MSKQLEAAALLRKAADVLSQKETDDNSTCSSGSSSNSTSNTPTSALRSIFAPYNSSRHLNTTASGRGRRQRAEPISFWSHRFCLLASSTQDIVPTREEKHVLHEAGIGEKKISFMKDNNTETFRGKLEESYPKLKDCGGFELLRTSFSSRLSLQPLRIPPRGFTTNYLANESNLGQALCFIRPIQREIDLGSETQELLETVKEECLTCRQMVPLNNLRTHMTTCSGTNSSSNDDEDDLPPPPRKRFKPVQVPVCQFASCVDKPEQCTSTDKPKVAEEKTGECRLCQKTFLTSNLESHAATCGDTCIDADGNTSRSLTEALEICEKEISSEFWNISVIRRHFMETAIQQFQDAEDIDWKKRLNIHFIGEEGVDSGGLTREFFSLFFEQSPLFEGGCFGLNSECLEKHHYNLMGKAIAMAILCGHPGPACLHGYIVDFILLEREPDYTQFAVEQLKREDIACAMRKIESAASQQEFTALMTEYADIFELVGFNKCLGPGNKLEAQRAVLKHFLFYRSLPAILQCIEGLKLHGVLTALRRFPEEGACLLKLKADTPSADVLNFFKPTFSTQDNEKAAEEMLVYNFHQLVKK